MGELPEPVTQHPENVAGLSGMTANEFEWLMEHMLYLTDHPEDPGKRQKRMARIAETQSQSSRPPRWRRRQAPEPPNGFGL